MLLLQEDLQQLAREDTLLRLLLRGVLQHLYLLRKGVVRDLLVDLTQQRLLLDSLRQQIVVALRLPLLLLLLLQELCPALLLQHRLL